MLEGRAEVEINVGRLIVLVCDTTVQGSRPSQTVRGERGKGGS